MEPLSMILSGLFTGNITLLITGWVKINSKVNVLEANLIAANATIVANELRFKEYKTDHAETQAKLTDAQTKLFDKLFDKLDVISKEVNVCNVAIAKVETQINK